MKIFGYPDRYKKMDRVTEWLDPNAGVWKFTVKRALRLRREFLKSIGVKATVHAVNGKVALFREDMSEERRGAYDEIIYPILQEVREEVGTGKDWEELFMVGCYIHALGEYDLSFDAEEAGVGYYSYEEPSSSTFYHEREYDNEYPELYRSFLRVPYPVCYSSFFGLFKEYHL